MAFYTGNLLDAALGPGAGTGTGEGVVRPAPMQPSAPQADPMAYYFQLGQQLLQQQQAMQRQQMQPQGVAAPAIDESFDLGTGMLTAGFDPNWLAQRLDAGSANGASIQSGGGGSIGGMGGAGKKPASSGGGVGSGSSTGGGGPGDYNYRSYLGGQRYAF